MKPNTFVVIVVGLLLIVLLVYMGSHKNGDGHSHSSHDVSCGHDHGSHEGHGAHEKGAIELTDKEIYDVGLETSLAASGQIDLYVDLTGEIKVNEDQMAHIVPRLEGVVVSVNNKLGDVVRQGEVMATIESRELADTIAAYLGAVQKYDIAKVVFEREEQLWKEKISSEQDYLEKKQILTEMHIEKRTAEQKLHAIGFDESYLRELVSKPDRVLTRLQLKAPFDGTVIEKHIVLGELVKTDSQVYVIADLSSVWVDLQIYPKDLGKIRSGQKVVISTGGKFADVEGVITYVGPFLGTDSRTALARVVLAKPSGEFRPGLFVTARVAVEQNQAAVLVSKNAIQILEGRKCVFIKDEHGFEPSFVETGTSNEKYVEIISGLTAGDEYVTKGAFELKSKIVTSTMDSHAGHGH